ncbi:hypothetical protein, partial [Pseudomonas fluorescens]|uniref:hypothetical protein n=1 Tax=Pseudomonas fluorescens TaxID=294 RepID=UPI001C4B803D
KSILKDDGSMMIRVGEQILVGNFPSTAAAPICRSELAREKLKSAAWFQGPRVIVNDLREQARSYKGPWMRPAQELKHIFKFE